MPAGSIHWLVFQNKLPDLLKSVATENDSLERHVLAKTSGANCNALSMHREVCSVNYGGSSVGHEKFLYRVNCCIQNPSTLSASRFSSFVVVLEQGLYTYTNQPTKKKKLTKGRVRRRRETSSLATFDHSCARNPLLEMVSVALTQNWVCPYANAVLSRRRDLILQTGDIAASGGLPQQRTCPFSKGF
jgi:hypothetical protein